MATTITNTSISADSITAPVITGSTSVTTPTVNVNTIDPTQGYLSIAQQNASGEGGEILLAGSNGNANAVIDNNNGAIRILQGASNRLNIDTNGSVRHPHNACYESSTGSFSSQGSANLNNMDFGSGLTARFNQGSKITYAHTNGGRFTVSNAGMYEILLQSFLDLNGDIRAYYVQMNVNGSIYTTWGHHACRLITATTHDLAHATTLANLSANDYLEFKYRMYDSPTVTIRPRVIIKQVG